MSGTCCSRSLVSCFRFLSCYCFLLLRVRVGIRCLGASAVARRAAPVARRRREVSVCGGLGGGELSGLEELMLVGGEVLIGLGGAPLVLDSRRELVAEDIAGVVSFRGGDAGNSRKWQRLPLAMAVFPEMV